MHMHTHHTHIKRKTINYILAISLFYCSINDTCITHNNIPSLNYLPLFASNKHTSDEHTKQFFTLIITALLIGCGARKKKIDLAIVIKSLTKRHIYINYNKVKYI